MFFLFESREFCKFSFHESLEILKSVLSIESYYFLAADRQGLATVTEGELTSRARETLIYVGERSRNPGGVHHLETILSTYNSASKTI